MSKVLKRVAVSLLAMAMLLSMAACGMSDYEKAVAFFEEGNYDEAEALFKELEDEEDSKLYLSKISWNRFYEYVENAGELELECNSIGTNGQPIDYKTILSAKDDNIIVKYSNLKVGDGFDLGVECQAVIKQGQPIADLEANGRFGIGEGCIDDTASGQWDISSFKKGDYVVWDNYEVTGHTVEGQPLEEGTKGICETGGGAIINALSCLVSGIVQAISESGLNVSIEDLGFTAW